MLILHTEAVLTIYGHIQTLPDHKCVKLANVFGHLQPERVNRYMDVIGIISFYANLYALMILSNPCIESAFILDILYIGNFDLLHKD